MIKCLLVDDEPLALAVLEGYVNTTPFLELVAKCTSAIQAMEIVESQEVDLVFSDIQMPNLNGMDFSKMLLAKNIKVVFTTAYEQYALEGYKVNALDYLLKPIDYSEFFASANKAKQAILGNATSAQITAEINTQSVSKEDYIFVKSDYKLVKIVLKDLIYIEGLKDYVKFYTVDSEMPILSLMSMKSLEEDFKGRSFMRVHRSFIVNLDKITTVERNRIVFGKKYIPVSEKYKETFQEYINSDLSH